jgi:hypothetical protein
MKILIFAILVLCPVTSFAIKASQAKAITDKVRIVEKISLERANDLIRDNAYKGALSFQFDATCADLAKLTDDGFTLTSNNCVNEVCKCLVDWSK